MLPRLASLTLCYTFIAVLPCIAYASDTQQTTDTSRRPGSYISAALGYVQARTWLDANDDHDKLMIGPLHTFGTSFRVGDAFSDWFTLGFQIQIISAKADNAQTSVFDLVLDATFYPWRGLGLRPSVGIGMGYAKGKNDWEFGGGGPAAMSLATLYEFRITKRLTLAPVAQALWITGGEFNGVFLFFGLELTKWFMTATS